MPSPVTYSQLRAVLAELGFREKRRSDGVTLEHRPSDTQFLFRPYAENDHLQYAEVSFVRKQLEERGLLAREIFEARLTRAPA